MKTPTEKAIEYSGYEPKEPLNGLNLIARDQFVGYLAGHAEGRREALEMAQGLADMVTRIANNIGMDALQTEYEPGWMAPEQAIKTIEMTQRLQRSWFTELKEALAKFETWREGK